MSIFVVLSSMVFTAGHRGYICPKNGTAEKIGKLLIYIYIYDCILARLSLLISSMIAYVYTISLPDP